MATATAAAAKALFPVVLVTVLITGKQHLHHPFVPCLSYSLQTSSCLVCCKQAIGAQFRVGNVSTQRHEPCLVHDKFVSPFESVWPVGLASEGVLY